MLVSAGANSQQAIHLITTGDLNVPRWYGVGAQFANIESDGP